MAWQGQLVPAEPFFELAKIAKEDNNPAIQKWILGACLSGSEASVHGLASFLNIKAAQQLAGQIPCYTPRPEQFYSHADTKRLIGFGFCENQIPFVSPIDALTQHAVINGASGTGKTNFLRLFILQAVRHCNVLVVDKDKEDYRFLAKLIPELLVLDAQRDFIWNPLEVHEGITPQQALNTFVTVASKSFSWLIGSQSEASKALYELFAERGIFDGSNAFPTLRDFRDKVAAKKHRPYGRTAGYQDSILNRLDALLLEAPKTYAYSKGFPVRELANRNNIVLEVKGLSEQHARFLVMHLLYTLFLYRIRTGQRGDWLRNLCVIDEASWLAPPGYNENLGFSPLSQVMRQSREAGIGLCFASQTANLDDSVFENSRFKFSFRLGHGKDIERVAKAMRLSREQADYISKLDTGQCIVRIPKVEPFLLRIPGLGV